MQVRRAEPGDVERWLDLLEEVAAERRWIGAEPPIDREAVRARWAERYFERTDSVAYLAVEGERIIGYAGLKGDGPSDLGMYVAADARRKGVGSALLKACIEWARTIGSHKIALQVWPHNAGAIALYERFGFEREGLLKRQWRRANGEIWDAVVMGLVLEAPIKADVRSEGCGE